MENEPLKVAGNRHETVLKLLLDEKADIGIKDVQSECSLDINIVMKCSHRFRIQ
jgi:hypothetical protein